MSQREAFETFISAPPFGMDVDRWPDNAAHAWPGQYHNISLERSWECWQEASRQMREAAAQTAHDLNDRTSARCIRAIPIE